jgi:hypothetical protein
VYCIVLVYIPCAMSSSSCSFRRAMWAREMKIVLVNMQVQSHRALFNHFAFHSIKD